MIWMRILFSFAFMASVVSSAAEGKTEAYRAVIGSDGIQHVEMVGGGYFFKPSHIIVKVNVPVELTVKKETGIVPHNIVMKEPAAGMEFEVSLSSEPQIIKFTPT